MQLSKTFKEIGICQIYATAINWYFCLLFAYYIKDFVDKMGKFRKMSDRKKKKIEATFLSLSLKLMKDEAILKLKGWGSIGSQQTRCQ